MYVQCCRVEAIPVQPVSQTTSRIRYLGKKTSLNSLSGELAKSSAVPVEPPGSHETSSVYHDPLVNKVINHVMEMGKKDLARSLVEKAFENIKRIQIERYHLATTQEAKAKIELSPKAILYKAVENAKPLLLLSPIKRGGITYQVPGLMTEKRSLFLALKWLLDATNEKERTVHFPQAFAWELLDAANNTELKEQIAELSKNFDRRGSIDDVLVKTEAGREAEGRAREMEAELVQCEKGARAREKELQPIYHEIAVQFAELHDTAERMLEKGCLFDIIPWRDSRRLLYWRLRRLLLQNEQERRIQSAVQTAGSMDHGAASATLRRWFTEDRGETQSHQWEHDNEAVCKWLEAQAGEDNSVLERNLRAIKQDAVMQAVNGLVMDLTPSQRAEFIRKLTALEMEQ